MEKSIKVLFVLPPDCVTGSDTTDIMREAFDVCKQNQIKVSWCKSDECTELNLQKTDVVVFQKFEGETFENLQSLKCVRIVGPRCLFTCLTNGEQIPNYTWPIFSMAMSDCVISCSSFTKLEKKEICKKVEYMGGFVTPTLTQKTTYLVSNSVKSEKYIKAAEANVKIMLSSWVDDVWQKCQMGNVHCSEQQFEKHKCPIFYNLVICCTGFNNIKRLELKNMIDQNGGSYKEQLALKYTDFLVCESGGASAKYKAAKKQGIKCVNMQWVIDSVRCGYALTDTDYKIVAGTSTPTKDSENLPPNFSMISNIGNQTSQYVSTIDMTDVTKLSDITSFQEKPNLKRKSDSLEHNTLVDSIDLKRVKKAGPFLDGCGIYLAGFKGEQREKLCKIMNFSGAMRYDDISERVTHVIVGDESCHELKALAMRISTSDCVVVNIHWLLESMEKQQPVDEQNFIINPVNLTNEPSSPLCKKALHVLRSQNNTLSQETAEASLLQSQSQPDVEIIQQYLHVEPLSQEDSLANMLKVAGNFDSQSNFTKSIRQSPIPQQMSQATEASSAVDDSSSQQFLPLFKGCKFMILNFTEEQQNSVASAVETLSGRIVSKLYKGIPDYIVVPVFSSEIRQTATEIVNDLWISECWQENELRPIDYFHKPFSVKENLKVLKNCVVTISSYVKYERNFLKNLIVKLGGVCQEQFSRIKSTKNNIVASTHLISPEASGRKYAAAIKWGLPVVNKDWLLECARLSSLLNETPYLVGNAKCKSLDTSKSLTVSSNDVVSNSTVTNKTPVLQHANVDSTITRTLVQKLNYSSVETPKSHIPQLSNFGNNLKDNSFNCPPVAMEKLLSTDSDHTPVNKRIKTVQSMSGVCSQITPVQKILAEARKNNLLGTPEQSLPMPQPWDHVDTPETPLGAFIRADPSPKLRKEMVRFLNTFPEHNPRRNSTPLSELKRKLWAKVLHTEDDENKQPLVQPDFDSKEDGDKSTEQLAVSDDFQTPSPKGDQILVNKQWEHLNSLITNSGGRSDTKRRSVLPMEQFRREMGSGNLVKAIQSVEPVKDSQPNTVSWEDDMMEYEEQQNTSKKSIPVFMLSGIDKDKREILMDQIEKLGGVVTNLSNYDPMCTHILCPKPSRNEKILSCMAAGKWILHPSYIDQCFLEGKLIGEEPYEFGNPKSLKNGQLQQDIDSNKSLDVIHHWRKEKKRTGLGAFHDFRAIVLSQKKDSIVRIIEAGGGVVIDASIPFNDAINATHCLLNFKSITNSADYIPLAEQGIYCINCFYINDFLHKTVRDIKDYILPDLKHYYEDK